MAFIAGKKVTVEMQVKENRDAIRASQREMDKELFRLDFENKNIMNQIKQLTQKNQIDVAKIHAKTLVRNRAAIKRFNVTKANLQCLSLRMMSISSMQSMTKTMNQSCAIMSRLNESLKIPEMAKMMANFQKEMSKLDDKQEMMDEMLDDAFQEDNENDETDKVVNQIIDEALGVNNGPNQIQQGQVVQQQNIQANNNQVK